MTRAEHLALVLESAGIAQQAGDVRIHRLRAVVEGLDGGPVRAAFDRILTREIRNIADADIAIRFLREQAERETGTPLTPAA